MPDTLRTIFAAKALASAEDERREPYEVVRERALRRRSERRPFLGALQRSAGAAIIAEIKRASPSAGLIARNFDAAAIGRCYDEAGADAISVLTERDHFLGELGYLDEVRAVAACPLLRKDFLWSRYHVAQSAAYGADAMLLIAAALDDEALRDCHEEGREYDLDLLVEVHDEIELERVLKLGITLIGVNNRNLRTLVTDLAVSEHLLPRVPKHVFAVSESGMRTPSDLLRLRRAGAGAFLIGETLMRDVNPQATLARLRESLASAQETR